MTQAIVIYTKDNCTYCEQAKAALKNRNLPFTQYNVPDDISTDEIRKKFPHARTFPVVLINGNDVGGFMGLDSFLRTFEAIRFASINDHLLRKEYADAKTLLVKAAKDGVVKVRYWNRNNEETIRNLTLNKNLMIPLDTKTHVLVDDFPEDATNQYGNLVLWDTDLQTYRSFKIERFQEIL